MFALSGFYDRGIKLCLWRVLRYKKKHKQSKSANNNVIKKESK